MVPSTTVYIAHFVAFLTVCVWGTTFVWTKLLLMSGLSPANIFTLRSAIAYVLLAGFSAWKHFRKSPEERRARSRIPWRDELMMVLLGLTGGSLYFLTENAAMLYTTATNTSLIVCSCPLFAALLIGLCYRSTDRMTVRQAVGSGVAFVGMAVVVLNGRFVLHLSPVGDALAFGACLCWAVYSLLMREMGGRYSTLLLTRKVFFYGLLTIIPYYIVFPEWPQWSLVCRSDVMFNLLFLGCIASMVCFLTWNWCMVKLGAVRATNWVYLNPITTIVFAAIILHEPLTPWLLCGTLAILAGIKYSGT